MARNRALDRIRADRRFAGRAEEIARLEALVRAGEPEPETVSTIADERLLTDGPYAETREQLGGYYIVDVADIDEAISWAAKIPGASTGSVEVRPIVVFADSGAVAENA